MNTIEFIILLLLKPCLQVPGCIVRALLMPSQDAVSHQNNVPSVFTFHNKSSAQIHSAFGQETSQHDGFGLKKMYSLFFSQFIFGIRKVFRTTRSCIVVHGLFDGLLQQNDVVFIGIRAQFGPIRRRQPLFSQLRLLVVASHRDGKGARHRGDRWSR